MANHKFSTTTNITTTYAGEAAAGYIAAALLSGSTLANNLITVKPNIPLKQVVKKVALTNILKDASCDFLPTGTLTLTERVIQPKELDVNLQFCKTDFLQDWEAAQVGYGLNTSMPSSLSDFILGRVASQIAASVETSIWVGGDTDGAFEGFTSLLAADSDVIDVSGTTVTAANVSVEMRKVTAAIPDTLYGNEDLILYVSRNVMQAYIESLGGYGSSGLGANGIQGMGSLWYNRNTPLSVDGIKVVLAAGLTSNKMVCAQASNLWFGTGLINDLNQVQLIDMSPIDGSLNVRYVARFKAAVQFGIGSEIVYYTA